MEETLRTEGNLKSPTEALGIGKTTAVRSHFKAPLPADDILNILRTTPSGLTAKEVADRLESTPSNIGSRLSKLVARFIQIAGVRCLSLIRALGVVDCQVALLSL